MKKREVRTFKTTEMRVVRAKDEKPKIVGHAAVFDSPTQIGSGFWGFMETVKPGAFTKSIKEDDVRGLFNHDPNIVLGRNTAGTLKLWEDETGLGYEITPPETQWANDLLESIERKDITGSSFGFEVMSQQWTEHPDDPDRLDERDLTELKLWDVSPVTFPAYPDTDVAKRAHEEFRKSLEPDKVEHRENAPDDAQEDAGPEAKTPASGAPDEEALEEEPARSSVSTMRKKLRLRA